MHIAVGNIGEPCSQTCARRGFQCRADRFGDANSCFTLTSRLPCTTCGESGEAHFPGIVMVAPPGESTAYRQCMRSSMATCEAKDAGVQRLCPCGRDEADASPALRPHMSRGEMLAAVNAARDA